MAKIWCIVFHKVCQFNGNLNKCNLVKSLIKGDMTGKCSQAFTCENPERCPYGGNLYKCCNTTGQCPLYKKGEKKCLTKQKKELDQETNTFVSCFPIGSISPTNKKPLHEPVLMEVFH